jgi:hypothetical protein
VLRKSHYFTENAPLYRDFKRKMSPTTQFFPMDDLLRLNPTASNAAEKMAKRLHTLNNHWIPFIEENLSTQGINIIALGRSHLFHALGVPEDADWPTANNVRTPVLPFQLALANHLGAEIKTFVVVGFNDRETFYDDADEDLVRPIILDLPRIFFGGG